jgi:putative uncharacterized protein (fragment)
MIEKLSSKDFSSYLKQYGNTICGRHPIGILLNVNHPALSLDSK